MKENQYLIKLYYMEQKLNGAYEFTTNETIYFGTDDVIHKKLEEYVKNIKNNFGINIDHYSVYKLVGSVNLINKKESVVNE